MQAVLSVVSLIIPFSVGFGLLLVLWPRDAPQHWLIKSALSIGVGCSVCSILSLAWLVAFGGPSRGLAFVEVAAGSLLSFCGLLSQGAGKPAESRIPRVWRPLLYGSCLVLLIAAGFIAWRVIRTPYGDWDAWESWNMKARMIYLGGDHWRDAFSPLLPDAGPDYPLLLPLGIVGLWTAIGSAAWLSPALLAAGISALLKSQTMVDNVQLYG